MKRMNHDVKKIDNNAIDAVGNKLDLTNNCILLSHYI